MSTSPTVAPPLLRLLASALVLICLALPIHAQGLTALTGIGSSSENSKSTDLADAIRQAAESGVSVVIVDSNGTIVGTGPTTEPPPPTTLRWRAPPA